MPKQPLPSVAFTVMGKLPTTVGVPERRPALDSVRPAGSTPLFSVNVVPPMVLPAVKLWLNAVPAVPVAVAGFVTVMVWQLTTSVYVPLTPVQPFASVPFTVMGKLPVTVGVPERRPALESVRPAGSVPLFSVNVAVPKAPVWVNDCEKGLFAVAVVVAGFATLIMSQTVRVKVCEAGGGTWLSATRCSV